VVRTGRRLSRPRGTSAATLRGVDVTQPYRPPAAENSRADANPVPM